MIIHLIQIRLRQILDIRFRVIGPSGLDAELLMLGLKSRFCLGQRGLERLQRLLCI